MSNKLGLFKAHSVWKLLFFNVLVINEFWRLFLFHFAVYSVTVGAVLTFTQVRAF